jgi:hypothetical protein
MTEGGGGGRLGERARLSMSCRKRRAGEEAQGSAGHNSTTCD